MKALEAVGLFAFLVLTLFLIIVLILPFLVIWSLDTLFGFHISYDLWTYLAILVLLMAIRGFPTIKWMGNND